MRLVPLAVLAAALLAAAPDPQLADLRATLTKLRAQPVTKEFIEVSGARSELTTAKHQLRDWIETQLAAFKSQDDWAAFSRRINEALKPVQVEAADEQNFLGTLGDVRVRFDSQLLIVTTSVGILCQHDESVYGYLRVNDRWQRVWQSEQNDYAAKKYAPQSIAAVHVWSDKERGRFFVLTLGNAWGCASSWHPVYYRVWRVDASSEPQLLIDRSESAYLRADEFIVGSIGQDARESNPPIDVLVEFAEGSADTRVHNREAVRHFLIEGDAVRRADPVALSPHDFVDEWLTRPWEESAGWSASPSLRRWHQDLLSNLIVGYFGTTMRCQAFSHWQVEVDPANPRRKEEADLRLYFLVRWDPPYHFKLESIRDKPFANCNQPDREADAWRTLFSNQEWRW